jgi:hypothetical protein
MKKSFNDLGWNIISDFSLISFNLGILPEGVGT